MEKFAYEIDQELRIECSGERGVVIARCDYKESEQQFLLRYKAADGRGVESWWKVSALGEV